ncbi:MAG TPA: hypothetical protein VL979_13340 [Solirubrobacteraceae bacterium]|nr:hypothetical protein [Solirubrobacteraceae bacterium]
MTVICTWMVAPAMLGDRPLPASGEKLAPGAAVALTVSAGRPCVVPLIRRSSSVGHAEHQLAAADCRAQVSYTHSRLVRRGRVVRVLARLHSRLAPRAKVKLVVSSGRRR